MMKDREPPSLVVRGCKTMVSEYRATEEEER